MKASIGRFDRRPGAVLPIGLAACTMQIQPPSVAFHRRSVSGVLHEVAERDGQLDDPMVVTRSLVLFLLAEIRRPIRYSFRLPGGWPSPPSGSGSTWFQSR